MTNDLRPQDDAAVEVLVYRDGVLTHRERCDSEIDAATVVATWEEQPGVHCDVVGFAPPHRHEAFEEPVDDTAPVDVDDVEPLR